MNQENLHITHVSKLRKMGLSQLVFEGVKVRHIPTGKEVTVIDYSCRRANQKKAVNIINNMLLPGSGGYR